MGTDACPASAGSRLRRLSSLPLIACLSGCAPAIAAGSEAGAEGMLEALREKENQAQLAEIATAPQVQTAVTEIGSSLTHGIVDAVKEELGSADLGDTTGALAAGIGDRTETVIRENIAPGVAEIVSRSVEASLATASSEQSLGHTREIAAAATEAAVRSMTAALADGIREDIRPALAETGTDVAPLATGMLADEDFKQAVGALAHEVSREIVLGSEGALDTIQREQDPGSDGTFFEGLGTNLSLGWAALVAFVAALSIGLVALIVLVVKGNAQRRHLERDTREREGMMMELMNTVIGDSDRISPALREKLQRTGWTPGAPPATSPG